MHAALYRILASPSDCAALKAEFRMFKSPSPDGVAALDGVESLRYLSAILQEITRCHPGVTRRQMRVSPEAPIVYTHPATGIKYSVPPGTV